MSRCTVMMFIGLLLNNVIYKCQDICITPFIGLLLNNVINMCMKQQVQNLCKCCRRESCDVQRIAIEHCKNYLNIDKRYMTSANVEEKKIVAMFLGFLQNITIIF